MKELIDSLDVWQGGRTAVATVVVRHGRAGGRLRKAAARIHEVA